MPGLPSSQRAWGGPGSKQCAGCKEDFELYCFPACKTQPDGHHFLCFPCRADANRMNDGRYELYASPILASGC